MADRFGGGWASWRRPKRAVSPGRIAWETADNCAFIATEIATTIEMADEAGAADPATLMKAVEMAAQLQAHARSLSHQVARLIKTEGEA